LTLTNLENTYLKLPEIFYSKINLKPVSYPKLVILNDSLGELLGLDIEELKNNEGINILAGNDIPEGSITLAEAYAGHQFGYFTMLGDGRAMLIGEQISPSNKRYDLHLKGSGKTPYSRGGDGRAPLGPMIREYIISEAMHYLGIPTTRSLAVVKTGEQVMRETIKQGAVLTRVASSHIRVGTFQYSASWGNKDDTKALADYTIKRLFPKIENDKNPYISLLKEVIKSQAALVAKWQLVGFIHGVMNTDNMSISGETIDYGPCAFMNTYDPNTVFSSIDHNGRYAYNNQPKIAEWNLYRFAETLLPLINNDKEESIKMAQNALEDFENIYEDNWISGMRNKLGIFNKEENDRTLIKDLLNLMKENESDYTNTFIDLTLDKIQETSLFDKEEFRNWYNTYQDRLKRQDSSKMEYKELMKKSNPSVIPRNHQVDKAIDYAVKESDYSILKNLLEALSNTYKYLKEYEEYMIPPEPSPFPYKTYCGT
jgi:uncharacterized protein YdiU (UPF0061 family)